MSERWNGMVLFILSILMIYLSWKLPIGSFRRPGPGLYPLLIAVILGSLTLYLFISTSLEKVKIRRNKWDLKKVSYILGILLVYSVCFESLGFLLSTFLFFLLLKPIIQKQWSFVLIGAILVALSSYFIFDTLLQSQLPKGILG
jgi:putative tricarboxylic transport membrane protein